MHYICNQPKLYVLYIAMVGRAVVHSALLTWYSNASPEVSICCLTTKYPKKKKENDVYNTAWIDQVKVKAYYFSSQAVCVVTGAKEVDIAATAEHIRDQRAETMNNKVSTLYPRVSYQCSMADSSKYSASIPDYSTQMRLSFVASPVLQVFFLFQQSTCILLPCLTYRASSLLYYNNCILSQDNFEFAFLAVATELFDMMSCGNQPQY